MPTGTVKWFNNAKGFGFILPDGGGEDLFAHYSSIEMEGYKTLKAGQAVKYELSDTDKGGHAKNISLTAPENPKETPKENESKPAESLEHKEEASLA